MSVSLVINGVSYPFPEPGEDGWGQAVTDWATAVTNALDVSTLADRTSDPSAPDPAQLYRRTDQGNILKYFDGTTAFGVALIP